MRKMKLILKKPVVTEKTARQQDKENKYTFIVSTDANKIEIKKAIEAKFNVLVDSINTINCIGASKRMGRFIGKKSDYKKAVVTLKNDYKISLFEENN